MVLELDTAGASPATREGAGALKRRLEEAIDGTMACMSEPEWAPFRPGTSYFAPPRPWRPARARHPRRRDRDESITIRTPEQRGGSTSFRDKVYSIAEHVSCTSISSLELNNACQHLGFSTHPNREPASGDGVSGQQGRSEKKEGWHTDIYLRHVCTQKFQSPSVASVSQTHHRLCFLLNASEQEALEYAERNGLFFLETSAKTAQNVGELFY
ncbi:hypothetical protein ZWY2020_037850 [Hordeum vulgare]|nr:hypothetical protein ZWY2020_037850 [Hordeum vulgare]